MDMRRFYILIGVAALALASLMAIQTAQLIKSVALSQQQFGVQVQQALTSVAFHLEKLDQERRMQAVSSSLDVDIQEESIVWFSQEDSLVEAAPANVITSRSKTLTIQYRPHTQARPVEPEQDSVVEQIIKYRGSPNMVRVLSATFNDLAPAGPPPADWLESDLVDTLLRQALIQEGIPLEYHFRVSQAPDQGLILYSYMAKGSDFPKNTHRAELFQLRRQPERLLLEVSFPGQNSFAVLRVWQQAAASLGLSLVLLFSFLFTVRTALRQKKMSEIKSDFINNMTHELKTPIATISLAADALAFHSEGQPEQVKRYLSVIKEENQRMHQQVERVLEAARFERQEVGWLMANTDMGSLLQRVADAFLLQVQGRNGVLEVDIPQVPLVVHGDSGHLTNLVFNLLDNANKYSPQVPHIGLSATVEGNEMVLAVSDQGIGIAKADHERIFSPFFRVSTGDRHEVKGFGLGLSYVREVVLAHQGSIEVKSAAGQGSIFVVRLPLLTANHTEA